MWWHFRRGALPKADPCGIAKVIERHLEGIIEDALDDPEYFFRDRYRFWNDLDKAALDEEKQSSIAG